MLVEVGELQRVECDELSFIDWLWKLEAAKMINAIFDEKELGPHQYPQLYWVQSLVDESPIVLATTVKHLRIMRNSRN